MKVTQKQICIKCHSSKAKPIICDSHGEIGCWDTGLPCSYVLTHACGCSVLLTLLIRNCCLSYRFSGSTSREKCLARLYQIINCNQRYNQFSELSVVFLLRGLSQGRWLEQSTAHLYHSCKCRLADVDFAYLGHSF